MSTKLLVQRDTRAWQLQVWVSFVIAVFLCGVGLAWLPGRDLDRAFMVMGYFFCLSAAFVLAKVRLRAGAGADDVGTGWHGDQPRLGGRMTAANVAFDDHPDAKRFTDRIETVTVDSVFAWMERSGLGGAPVRLQDAGR